MFLPEPTPFAVGVVLPACVFIIEVLQGVAAGAMVLYQIAALAAACLPAAFVALGISLVARAARQVLAAVQRRRRRRSWTLASHRPTSGAEGQLLDRRLRAEEKALVLLLKFLHLHPPHDTYATPAPYPRLLLPPAPQPFALVLGSRLAQGGNKLRGALRMAAGGAP